MAILDKLSGLFSSGAAKLVESVGDALDKNITNKEELAQAKLELEKEINRHLESVSEQANKEAELYLKDADSARNREIQIATSEKAPLLNKVITPVLATGTVLLTFILFYAILFKKMGTEKDIIIYVLGALTAITGQIFSYYFGSSSSSAAKQKHIESITSAK